LGVESVIYNIKSERKSPKKLLHALLNLKEDAIKSHLFIDFDELSEYSKPKLRIFVALHTDFAIILNCAACGTTFPKLYFPTEFQFL
jgi:hypothetical protein